MGTRPVGDSIGGDSIGGDSIGGGDSIDGTWAENPALGGVSAPEPAPVVPPSLRPSGAQGALPDLHTGTITYVLDTSVLLSDPLAMVRFAEHDVVLPVVVVTELEAKRHHPDLATSPARRSGSSTTCANSTGTSPSPPADREERRPRPGGAEPHERLLPARRFRLGDNDTRILAVAKNLQLEGKHVVLVSKDLPMRIKASASGIHAEEYRAELARDRGYTGMVTAATDEETMTALYDGDEVEIPRRRASAGPHGTDDHLRPRLRSRSRHP